MSIPVLTLRQLVQFPANVYGDTGIAVTKSNGNYTIETDWSGFGTISTVPTSPTNYVLTFDTASGVYTLVPSSLLGGGGGGGVSDAPVDGFYYGRLDAGWAKVAPLNSPMLTGLPMTPTAAPGTNTMQIASTAFVLANAGSTPATATPIMDGAAAVGVATKYAREDHVHPSDTSRAATVHTHTAANVTDFSEAVDDRVGSLLVAGSNITLTYNDAGNALTIDATVSGGGGGDVVGPSSAVTDRIVTFNGTTGKVIKDSGSLISALQPSDADLTAVAALSGTGIARRTATTPTWTVGDAVANADLATMAASTFKANTTGSTAVPTDVTIAGLTTKASPSTSDWLLLSDSAASGAFKKTAWPAAVTGAALTRTSDTNVTLTLGGTPATALLQATSITAGWTGTLAAARGGFGSDVSAASGVPLFLAGVPTFTSTTGSGNVVRAGSPTFTGIPSTPYLALSGSLSSSAAVDGSSQIDISVPIGGHPVVAPGQIGLLILCNNLTGDVGLYLLSSAMGGGLLIGSAGGEFVAPTSSPATAKTSVAYNGSSGYELFHGFGGTISYAGMFLRVH